MFFFIKKNQRSTKTKNTLYEIPKYPNQKNTNQIEKMISHSLLSKKKRKGKDLSREKKWDLRADLVKEEEDMRERERSICDGDRWSMMMMTMTRSCLFVCLYFFFFFFCSFFFIARCFRFFCFTFYLFLLWFCLFCFFNLLICFIFLIL